MKYCKNRLHVLISLVVVLLVFSKTGNSQTVSLDSVKFAIGSKVSLKLELPFKVNSGVKWPTINDTLTKSVEVLSKSKIDTIIDQNTGEKTLQQIISITSFDTGFQAIPPFIFEGKDQRLATDPLLIEVYKLKVDPVADIKDIKPILKAPITFREILPWIIGIIFIAAVLFFLRYYLKKRKTTPYERIEPEVKIPAWDIALSKIERLKEQQLWQQGEIKEYYTQLTDILREYFEKRYKVYAAEMTSTEIIESMDKVIKREEAMKSLKEVLFLADMAKFAKAQPGQYENEQSIAYGIDIINYTKPSNTEIELNNSKKLE